MHGLLEDGLDDVAVVASISSFLLKGYLSVSRKTAQERLVKIGCFLCQQLPDGLCACWTITLRHAEVHQDELVKRFTWLETSPHFVNCFETVVANVTPHVELLKQALYGNYVVWAIVNDKHGVVATRTFFLYIITAVQLEDVPFTAG